SVQNAIDVQSHRGAIIGQSNVIPRVELDGRCPIKISVTGRNRDHRPENYLPVRIMRLKLIFRDGEILLRDDYGQIVVWQSAQGYPSLKAQRICWIQYWCVCNFDPLTCAVKPERLPNFSRSKACPGFQHAVIAAHAIVRTAITLPPSDEPGRR